MENQPPHAFSRSVSVSRLPGTLHRVAGPILGLFFPWNCPGCDLVLPYPGVICKNCIPLLPRIRKPFCRRCGTPFPGHWTVDVCAECKSKRSPLIRTRSVFLYEGLVRDMIRAGKFSKKIRAFRYFAEEAYLHAEELLLSRIEAVVPVPMHPSREWERTYNQADLIASRLSQWSGVPRYRILEKSHRTLPQSSLSSEARRKNLQGVFRVHSTGIMPSSVLLIDDVITTGTTLEECARVLRRAGCRRVYALTIARAVLNQ